MSTIREEAVSLSIHNIKQSGLDLWAVRNGSELLGTFWTENAARVRMSEIVRKLQATGANHEQL